MNISQGSTILRVGLQHKEKLRILMTGAGDLCICCICISKRKGALKRINRDNGFARTGWLYRLPDLHNPFTSVGVIF